MRLPASASPRARCSLEVGDVRKLQSRLFTPSQATITVTEVRREPLAELSLADARREGYAGVQGALEGWKRTHGLPQPDQLVWVVSFARGDESEFVAQDTPVYLRRGGGYTTVGDVLAAGEVLSLPGAAERARVVALARRQVPQRHAARQATEAVETCREVMTGIKANTLLKAAARMIAAAERAERAVQADEVVDLAASVAGTGSAGEVGPLPRSVGTAAEAAA